MRSLRSRNTDNYKVLALLAGNRDPDMIEENLALANNAQTAVADSNLTANSTLTTETKPLELNETQVTLFKEILTREQRTRLIQQGPLSLTEEERLEAATSLLLAHNKVTHIYELLKAAGSNTQLTQKRSDGIWYRRPAIAEKHHNQLTVDIKSETIVMGNVDSTFIYHQDPRQDSPEELSQAIVKYLNGSDPAIIRTWLKS